LPPLVKTLTTQVPGPAQGGSYSHSIGRDLHHEGLVLAPSPVIMFRRIRNVIICDVRSTSARPF
jgi:hypothetical protein